MEGESLLEEEFRVADEFVRQGASYSAAARVGALLHSRRVPNVLVSREANSRSWRMNPDELRETGQAKYERIQRIVSCGQRFDED